MNNFEFDVYSSRNHNQCLLFKLCIRWRQFNQQIIIHSISEQHHNELSTRGIIVTNTQKKCLPLHSTTIFIGTKISNQSRRTENCIITVLDANDLPPLNSNLASTLASDGTVINGTSTASNLSTHDNQQSYQHGRNNNNRRNVLHRFLIFHRSDLSQI